MPEDLGASSFLFTEAEVAEVQARARERADALKRKFLTGDGSSDNSPDA